MSSSVPLRKALQVFREQQRKAAGHRTPKQGATTPVSWIYVQGPLKVSYFVPQACQIRWDMFLSRFNHLFTIVKPTIFKQAVELGATCTFAFTDRVTHLVASGHGGEKYMVS